MSSIVWDGDNLIQRLGRNSAELGHVKFDQDSSKVVLWLRDIRNVFGVNGGYVRGDEFASMSEAKKLAAVFIFRQAPAPPLARWLERALKPPRPRSAKR